VVGSYERGRCGGHRGRSPRQWNRLRIQWLSIIVHLRVSFPISPICVPGPVVAPPENGPANQLKNTVVPWPSKGPFPLPVIARMPCPLLDKSFPDTILVNGKKEHLCRAGFGRERPHGRRADAPRDSTSDCQRPRSCCIPMPRRVAARHSSYHVSVRVPFQELRS
jgi:hypothetical protein